MIESENSKKTGPGGAPIDSSNPDLPKGRWAQRLPNNAVTFKSHYDTDSVIPFPPPQGIVSVLLKMIEKFFRQFLQYFLYLFENLLI